VLILLAVLTVRADAGPDDDDDGSAWEGDAGESVLRGGEARSGEPRGPGISRGGPRGDALRGEHVHLYVPITNALVARVVAIAPPVGDVVASAYRAAGLSGDPTIGWRRRSRWSSLIPMIGARAGQNQSWREIDDPTISRGMGLDVRASWHLDHLLFDPNEPRIAMLDVARRRERRRVAAIAIHLYFDWVAARAAADADVRAELDAQEKLAELDALTDGWFSRTIAKRAELR
jgi:hypothetical protein